VDYGLGYIEPSAGQSLNSTQQQRLLIPQQCKQATYESERREDMVKSNLMDVVEPISPFWNLGNVPRIRDEAKRREKAPIQEPIKVQLMVKN
jgi:hypothetical protein